MELENEVVVLEETKVKENKIKKLFKENRIFLLIVCLIILARIFVFSVNEVDGQSMETTLHDKDIIVTDLMMYKVLGIERFDIIVFEYQDMYLIKRVIGLPGETVEYRDHELYIDGKKTEVPEELEGSSMATFDFAPTKVSSDQYFVMGDNRMYSLDSTEFGPIEEKDIIGKSLMRVRPFKTWRIL